MKSMFDGVQGFTTRIIVLALVGYAAVLGYPYLMHRLAVQHVDVNKIICTTKPHTKDGINLMRPDYEQFDEYGTTHYIGLPPSSTGEWCDLTAGDGTVWGPTKTATGPDVWTCVTAVGLAQASCSPGGHA